MKGNRAGLIERDARALIDFIEKYDVQDEFANDGDGYIDTWRSQEFHDAIDNLKKSLEVRDE